MFERVAGRHSSIPGWQRAAGAVALSRDRLGKADHRRRTARGGRRRVCGQGGRPPRGRRHPVIIPFIGHGTTRARPRGSPAGARARGRRAVGAPEAAEGGDAPTPRSRRAVLRASIARFLTAEVPDAEVTLHLPGGRRRRPHRPGRVRRPRGGTARRRSRAGWRSASTGPAGASATARVLITDPEARIGLVSDVDDTIVRHRAHPRSGVPARHAAHRRQRAHAAARSCRPLPGARDLAGGRARAAGLLRLDEPVEPARDAPAVRGASRFPARSAAAHRLGAVPHRAVPDRGTGPQARAGAAAARRAPAPAARPHRRQRAGGPRDLRDDRPRGHPAAGGRGVHPPHDGSRSGAHRGRSTRSPPRSPPPGCRCWRWTTARRSRPMPRRSDCSTRTRWPRSVPSSRTEP